MERGFFNILIGWYMASWGSELREIPQWGHPEANDRVERRKLIIKCILPHSLQGVPLCGDRSLSSIYYRSVISRWFFHSLLFCWEIFIDVIIYRLDKVKYETNSGIYFQLNTEPLSLGFFQIACFRFFLSGAKYPHRLAEFLSNLSSNSLSNEAATRPDPTSLWAKWGQSRRLFEDLGVSAKCLAKLFILLETSSPPWVFNFVLI